MLNITVYSGPGCMKCHITRSQLAKAGIPFTAAEAADHEDLVPMVEGLGLKRELPVVVVENTEGEDMVWTGLSHDNIRALKYLAA